MTLYCSLHFPRWGKDELQVLGIKTAPPLAVVKWCPMHSVRQSAKHKPIWRRRTLGASMSTMPASHPTSYTHSLEKIRTNFVTAFIPVNNPHNEKPMAFSFFQLLWPYGFFPSFSWPYLPTLPGAWSPFPMLPGTQRHPEAEPPIPLTLSLIALSIFLL